MNCTRIRSCAASLALLALAPAALAVDGAVLISKKAVEAGGITPGDAPGFPVTITRSGTYRLTEDLQVNDKGTPAFEIAASDVELDLNGLVVQGAGKEAGVVNGAPGIRARAGAVRVRVFFGTVTHFPGDGVQLGPDAIADEVVAIENGGNGIKLAERGDVVSCFTARNSLNGVLVVSGRVRNTFANENDSNGFALGSGRVLIEENSAADNTQFGLFVTTADPVNARSAYRANVFSGNKAAAQVSGQLIDLKGNLCNNGPCP